jgi:enamine deaminase RidA (YjgF/YER057c/UK114 family)
MQLTPINPTELGAPLGYSHGMLAPAGGRLLAIAGQIAWTERNVIVSDRFHEQFGMALSKVVAVVHAAGGGPEHIAQLTIFVTTRLEYLQSLKDVGRAYRALMGKHYPAMALVEVAGLLEPRAKVEIQGLAVVP